jgi:hypothetical protein
MLLDFIQENMVTHCWNVMAVSRHGGKSQEYCNCVGQSVGQGAILGYFARPNIVTGVTLLFVQLHN